LKRRLNEAYSEAKEAGERVARKRQSVGALKSALAAAEAAAEEGGVEGGVAGEELGRIRAQVSKSV